MKVVHVTPTYFDNSSYIGGGERYPTELASWMSRTVETTLVSFSSKRQSYYHGSLKIETYPVSFFLQNNYINAFNPFCLTAIAKADIVHIHVVNALASVLSTLTAQLLGKRIFVTDYGGGSGLGYLLNQKLPTLSCYRRAIAYSSFGLNALPISLQQKAVLIKGGIDTEKFAPSPEVLKKKTILFVGRILSHKGINYLIEAFRFLNAPDYKLKILGKPYNEKFLQELKQLAGDLSVEFIHDADDQQLLQEYRQAAVTVLPSVHTDCYGNYSPVPELMGFTLLESQACGTPVICTDAGAMHEFIEDGKTGFVVSQNSGEVIATALSQILDLSPEERSAIQQRCREWVHSLSWPVVVQQHLELYQRSLK